MTLANRITIVRLALIPAFAAAISLYTGVSQWPRYAAIAIYCTAAASDALDGFIARRFDQRSQLGRVLDPLADKLLVNVAFVFLAVNAHLQTQVPLWLPVFVLGRDAFITGGAYLIKRTYGHVEVKPRLLGKANTAAECAAILGVLLELVFAWELLMIMVAVGVLSWFDYFIQGLRQAARKRRA